MNYSALIQNRKSVRAFTDRYVSFDDMDKIKAYHRNSVRRLLPELKTELRLFGLDDGRRGQCIRLRSIGKKRRLVAGKSKKSEI